MSLLAGAASIGISWLKAGSVGDWYPEVGTLVNNSAEGGILESLENETGKEYPHLMAQRQDCVDKWRNYQRAMPWSKTGELEAYQAAVNAFAEAVQNEEKASYNLLGGGGLAGVVEVIKKPYVLIAVIVVIIGFFLVVLIKR